MNKTPLDLIAEQEFMAHATDAGKLFHAKLARVIIDGDTQQGDSEIIKHILSVPNLSEFFNKMSKTEVPVAGNIAGHFVSRRIDRLCINHDTKTIQILDYKTDTDCNKFKGNYIKQLYEYRDLMHMIYPDYHIDLFLLWLHDWHLEQI